MASFSDYLEKKILDHITGKTSFTAPTNVYLALCTVVPTDADTGATITEANYTGYSRLLLTGSNFNAASGTSPAHTENTAGFSFAACTGGSSTIVGWALCDALTTGTGNVLVWGTTTSTVVNTTNTPPTVSAGGLQITLD